MARYREDTASYGSIQKEETSTLTITFYKSRIRFIGPWYQGVLVWIASFLSYHTESKVNRALKQKMFEDIEEDRNNMYCRMNRDGSIEVVEDGSS
jgi:hypothetical protein